MALALGKMRAHDCAVQPPAQPRLVGLVDPGVACWVGMSGEPEAREERGLSPWQFAVRGATWSSAELGLRSKAFGPVHSGAILYTLKR